MKKTGIGVEATNEQKILWKIFHENIIRYFDHFELRISNWSTICIITEYCEVRLTNNQTIKNRK